MAPQGIGYEKSNHNAKGSMREKLNAAVATDLKNTKIERTINRVRETDGKITADYEVRGKLSDKDLGGTSYHDFPKIFDNWSKFNSYSKAFFEADPKQIAEIIKSK